MIEYTRKELKKMFDMSSDLARYHIAMRDDETKADDRAYHIDMIKHYIKVREDLIHILLKGS